MKSLLKERRILPIVLASLLFLGTASCSEWQKPIPIGHYTPKIIAYYPHYRTLASEQISQLPWSKMDAIIYAFFHLNEFGDILDEKRTIFVRTQNYSNLPTLAELNDLLLEAHKHNLNFLISFGGADASQDFEHLVVGESKTFVAPPCLVCVTIKEQRIPILW